MFRRSDGNTSISPENIAGQSLSVGFRPLPQTTPPIPKGLRLTLEPQANVNRYDSLRRAHDAA
ncbi:hypothetical protein A3X26_24455 [Salmonella enterica subsp. enterica serovar Typhimurium]|uniref:Uncharacterized protein n=1 Tax=Salmonella typhimurium TaxID=90371 RepID=A0A706ERZ1_SALTM|nr:hypothetical protein [Salmonella enterica subsp. enterica serovar Typhimurium]ECF0037154.1 hypothetical protein [Salmonella enterica subsp. enterica serovar Typhimurium]EDA7972472.1 hypothetical protein [Salmonella enterica subsp. enterica serovar Typhimurium]EDH5996763.1 hypothetical protein [Salmonella enterica subsp. enterica serovar Typhimurium]EDI0481648.1 hypothetical protein [Salmonella enterica subsp. enterica serovar Typhimurium]